MEVQALTRYARMSPKKVREVARTIQGRKAAQAVDLLGLIPRKSARLIQKTLKSAIANAENNNNLSADNLTVKSAIDVAGVRCETGSPTRRGRVAATDATVVARLRQAGAIVLGTTNVAEMLMAYETVNPLHGLTRNPWDPTRTPGGSSGGEAVAIATGCSGGGIGSDGGGSIRVPAHFSGICGFKPTPGRVPTTGHQPACLGPFSIVGAVGPMARTVADLRLLDEALSGYDVADPMSVPRTEGRRQKAEGRRQKAEGRRQKQAQGKVFEFLPSAF